MGSKWFTGGVVAARHGRIQFDFMFEGIRYRPSIRRPPSEANLRRARERLDEIKRQIELGTFSFEEEFPDYRLLRRLTGTVRARTCDEVFDAFLEHCETRFAMGDMAAVTLSSYRRVLNGVWRPPLGKVRFRQVQYSRLVKIANRKAWSKKTYNNAISIVRNAFDFGHRDHPDQPNPAVGLRCMKIMKKDRPKIDPFAVQDAETLIAAIHRDWGEAQGNYDEFRFFTGMRPSEAIALVLSDLNLTHGIVSVNKARVAGVDRDSTKTGEDRRVSLCPRALAVLKRQLALRARLEAEGAIDHDHVFFEQTGAPLTNLQQLGRRWRQSLRSIKLRYRRPYTARHSSVSWNLMIGNNFMWVAKQHGHSATTMFRVYGTWIEGAVESDIEAIKRSMNVRSAEFEQVAKRGHLDPHGSASSRRCHDTRRAACRMEILATNANLAVDLPVQEGAERQTPEIKRICMAEREGFEFRLQVGSASYGFRKRFGPHRSPEIPVAVTGAVTENPSLSSHAMLS